MVIMGVIVSVVIMVMSVVIMVMRTKVAVGRHILVILIVGSPG